MVYQSTIPIRPLRLGRQEKILALLVIISLLVQPLAGLMTAIPSTPAQQTR